MCWLSSVLPDAWQRDADAGLLTFAHVGLRAALEQHVKLQGGNPDGSGGLAAAILTLRIGETDSTLLGTIKEAGDGAIHGRFIPARRQFVALAGHFMEFLLREVVGSHKVKALAGEIPKRAPKKSKS